MEEGRCSLCTNNGGYEFTEYTTQEEVPMSKLRCGHDVHTHCFINHLFMQKVDAECKECNASVIHYVCMYSCIEYVHYELVVILLTYYYYYATIL